jgi:ubiquinone/menaquinone biosynthesis C-methylase UbiE
MNTHINLLLMILGTFGIGVLIWRFLSRRWSLPCPTSLIWMLEHRLMDNVAGSKIIIRRAKIQPGMVVLDAGCGPGRVSLPLANYLGSAGKVIALDVQPAMLALLRGRIKQAGVNNIEILETNLGGGGLPVAAIDRALMVTVLGEIPNRRKALEEIYHALKPGGILSITEVLPDPHYQSRKTVRSLGRQAGFMIDEVYVGFRAFTCNLIKPSVNEEPIHV